MDPLKKRLEQLTTSQGKLAKELNDILKEYESQDFIRENTELKQVMREQKETINILKEKQADIEKENSNLRYALQEQILDEKLNLIKVSKEKLNTYFRKSTDTHENELTAFEEQSRQQINRLIRRADLNLTDDKQPFIQQLKEISTTLNARIQMHKEAQAQHEKNLLHQINSQYNQLETEEVSEEVIQKRIKQNQMEMKIGLHWINKLGILLIILGVGAAFRYSYTNWFNDYFKGALFFLLGAGMLAAGEFFYRKAKLTFAFGLLGGGIAVLYGSVFFSYFLLEIIDLYVALVLSVLVTVTAVILSLRYHSRTICSFGLVGGYLPLYSYLFAFGLDSTAVYVAMGYLILLNLSILLIAFWRQWTVVHYISFLFNIPSMLVLLSLSGNDQINMGYSIATFLLYLGITLAYSMKNKVTLKYPDIILLAFNTFISCTVLYFLFNQIGWDDFRGLLALIFCGLYLGLGKFMEKALPKERHSIVLFYGTSLTFAILMIPFQFGMEWIALGWLVEAIVIMLYASYSKIRILERAGWFIFFLCLGTFYLEVYAYLATGWPLTSNFNFKYFTIMIGMLFVTCYYLWNQQKQAGTTNVFPTITNFFDNFKYFTLANLWIYLLYQSRDFYHEWVPSTFGQFVFYEWMMFAFISIGLAYALTKVPFLYDRMVKYICLLLYAVGTLIGLMVTMTLPTLHTQWSQNTAVEYLALALLMVFNVLVFFSGRDLLLAFIRQQYKNLELYPLILGIYLLGVMAAFLNVQFHLGDVGLVFSSVFLILAVGYIFYGFKKKYVYIRRLGLGLTILSTGKLILYDLSFLTEGSKIVAYFAFGIALLGISYMYQKVSSHQEGESNVAEM